MRTIVLCPCIQVQYICQNCRSFSRLGSALALKNRAQNQGAPVISTWYLDNFKTNALFFNVQIGQTVLHMVSITGEPRLCALFLRANADPNLADDRQFRPIHRAYMQSTVLCPCIQAQCIGRNSQSSARLGSTLAPRNRVHNRGSLVISTWYLHNFKTNAGAFEQKLQFCFIFHFTDWADGVAYGVDHRRTPVVCPISSSQCRPQSGR